MSINQKDIKLLWGRSGGICSYPDCNTKLHEDSTATGANIVIGEQAHIVAKDSGGPRGVSILADDARDEYANLILLCPTHHTLIDKDPTSFPIELLHKFKTDHEEWVSSQLNTADIHAQVVNEIYATAIDAVINGCLLDDFPAWTSYAFGMPPEWPVQITDHLYELTTKIQRTAWPGIYPELEISIYVVIETLNKAVIKFSEHSERDGNKVKGVRFYRYYQGQDNYHEHLELFNKWNLECDVTLKEFIKSLNWMRSNICKHINPRYMIDYGKFDINNGNAELAPEYTSTEIAGLVSQYQKLLAPK